MEISKEEKMEENKKGRLQWRKNEWNEMRQVNSSPSDNEYFLQEEKNYLIQKNLEHGLSFC